MTTITRDDHGWPLLHQHTPMRDTPAYWAALIRMLRSGTADIAQAAELVARAEQAVAAARQTIATLTRLTWTATADETTIPAGDLTHLTWTTAQTSPGWAHTGTHPVAPADGVYLLILGWQRGQTSPGRGLLRIGTLPGAWAEDSEIPPAGYGGQVTAIVPASAGDLLPATSAYTEHPLTAQQRWTLTITSVSV